MGDSEWWWDEARGLSAEGSHSFREAWTGFQAKGKEWWEKAELEAAEVISAIQPSPESEESRRGVVDYVSNLIKSCVICEVVKFGSVSLKTYLPDGDIDLTLISPNPEVKRKWFDNVFHVLQREAADPNADFWVTDVQGVRDAEVKLVKIYVGKILVDISFDHLGGVCTLCFLEEVDRLIGEDHLFKRSIILVKAWCYYESRLLSAANNLMSTYALETLVLYIFHMFHESLHGPLQVLYIFLEFFSGFDWDKYCVSLSGPVLCNTFSEEPKKSSEDPQKPALTPRREGSELLFTKEFLDACERVYGGLVPLNQTTKAHKFAVKSLNIIDPLRRTNNLGRSVNQGNCARIRRAFALGARTMRCILNAKDEEDFSNKHNQFFKTCIYRSTQLEDGALSPQSFQPRVPNGVLKKIGGGRVDDALQMEKKDDSSRFLIPRNGYHIPPSSLNRDSLPVKKAHPQLTPCEVSENEDASAAPELASGKRMKAGKLKFLDLNSRDTKIALKEDCDSNGLIFYSRPHISEEERITCPIRESLEPGCDVLPVASGSCVRGEKSSAMFSERKGSGCKPMGKLGRRDFCVASSENAEVSQKVGMANGNHGTQHLANGSALPSSRNGSEDERECLSQTSSKESFETTRDGSSSLLQDRPVDSTSDCSGQTEAQASSSGKRQVGAGNEEGRECSAPPPEVDEQSRNRCEHSEASSSKGRGGRKGRAHQENGCQSKDLDGSGIGHGKLNRRSSKSKAGPVEADKIFAQDGGGSHLQQSLVPASSYQHPHRPYPTGAGPGRSGHPLASRLPFDPGTARMSGGGGPGPSQNSPMSYVQPYSLLPTMYRPRFPHPPRQVVYGPALNIHKRNSPAKGDENAKNRTGHDANGSLEVPVEHSGHSPRSRSRSKTCEQQIPVGVLEWLEAEGVMASTSSRRSQTVAAKSTPSADPGSSSSDFLAGDLKLQLRALAFGPFCEYFCSPSLSQILYPACGLEIHAHKPGSWEGPGRPEAGFHAQLLPPQFYPFPQLPQFSSAGFFPGYPLPLSGGVGLSPRPRGTGAYILNNVKPNSRPPGRGQNRGAGQTASSSQHQEDRHHQSRDQPHGPRHRAPANKEQGSSTRVVENRTAKTDGARDLHHPRKHHDSARASAPQSSVEPAVSSHPAEELQPSEVIASCAPVPSDGREPYPDPPEQDIPVVLSDSPVCNGSPELGDSFLLSNFPPLPSLFEKSSGPRLDISASVGDSCDSDKSDAISTSPTIVADALPTTTPPRTGLPNYLMKEEDFPPLGGRRMNRAKIMAEGRRGIANVIATSVSM